MDKFDQYKRLIRTGIIGVELCIESVFFAYVWYAIYNTQKVSAFENKGNLMMIGLYIIFLIMFVYMYGGTKFAYHKKGQLILSQVLGTLIANAVIYMSVIMVLGKFPFPTVWPIVIMSMADVVVIVILNQVSDVFFRKLFPPKQLLLICNLAFEDMLRRKIAGRKDLYEVSACLSAEESLEMLKAEVEKYNAMMLYGVDVEKRDALVKYCYERDIRIYIAPEVTDILLRGADSVHSFDTPFLLLRNYGLSFEQRFIKRSMDVIISLIITLIALPFMALTALAIKLEDRGPALYKQERVTLNGRKFYIYKFRSMVMDAEKYGAQFSTKNDPRITKVGRFIRATRLDELPQLWNILNGDMSIVGPRPERQVYIDEFCQETPEFIYRLKVKAGLTGYAQIYGKYNTTPLDKLKLDLMYIESYSILLDIKLIFLTLKVMFMKESTEGVEEGQNHA